MKNADASVLGKPIANHECCFRGARTTTQCQKFQFHFTRKAAQNAIAVLKKCLLSREVTGVVLTVLIN